MMLHDLDYWERAPEFAGARRFLLEAGLRKELYGLLRRRWTDQTNRWHEKRLVTLVIGNRDSKLPLSAFQPIWFIDLIQNEFKLDIIDWRQRLLETYDSFSDEEFIEMAARQPPASPELESMWNERADHSCTCGIPPSASIHMPHCPAYD
jgi:hypothetical protein